MERDLLVSLLEEYRDALYTDNRDRIRRLGEIIRIRMMKIEGENIEQSK